MYCSHCGAANTPGAKFCRNCGRPLLIVPAGAEPVTVPPGRSAAGGQGAMTAPAAAQAGTMRAETGAAGISRPASPPGQQGAQLDTNTVLLWYNKYKPYAWIFWSAVLLLYIIMTKNFLVLIIGLAITWLVRTYCHQIDRALRPIWPLRNLIPAQTRKLLGWVVPVAISFYVSLQPALWPKLGWLPLVGPTGSMTIFMALIGAFTAYVLVREPSHLGAR